MNEWQSSYLDGTPEIVKLLDAVNQLNDYGTNSNAARCRRKSVHRICEEQAAVSVKLNNLSFRKVRERHCFALTWFE